MSYNDERAFRLCVLENMISEVDASIEQLRRTLEGLQQRIRDEERQRELLAEKHSEFARAAEPKEESTSIAEFVAKALMENGEPMRVKDIVRTLVENGITSSQGESPVNSVLSALSRRSDLFERVSRGCYVLRSGPTTPIRRRTSARRVVYANA